MKKKNTNAALSEKVQCVIFEPLLQRTLGYKQPVYITHILLRKIVKHEEQEKLLWTPEKLLNADENVPVKGVYLKNVVMHNGEIWKDSKGSFFRNTTQFNALLIQLEGGEIVNTLPKYVLIQSDTVYKQHLRN